MEFYHDPKHTVDLVFLTRYWLDFKQLHASAG